MDEDLLHQHVVPLEKPAQRCHLHETLQGIFGTATHTLGGSGPFTIKGVTVICLRSCIYDRCLSWVACGWPDASEDSRGSTANTSRERRIFAIEPRDAQKEGFRATTM